MIKLNKHGINCLTFRSIIYISSQFYHIIMDIENIREIQDEVTYDQQNKMLAIRTKNINYWDKAESLASSANIQQLFLKRCGVNDNSIKNLNKLNSDQLRRLSLFQNNLTAKGIKNFLAKAWPKLTQFFITREKIENNGLEIILNEIPRLTKLSVKCCQITSLGIKSMTQHNLQHLILLQLQNNHINSNGIKFLTKVKMPQLKFLCIDGCLCGDQGFKYLTKGHWRLNQLHVDDNKIGLAGVQFINNLKCKNLIAYVMTKVDLFCYQKFMICQQNNIALMCDLSPQYNETIFDIIKEMTYNRSLKQYAYQSLYLN